MGLEVLGGGGGGGGSGAGGWWCMEEGDRQPAVPSAPDLLPPQIANREGTALEEIEDIRRCLARVLVFHSALRSGVFGRRPLYPLKIHRGLGWGTVPILKRALGWLKPAG